VIAVIFDHPMGFGSSKLAPGGFFHLLLIIMAGMILIRFIQGRRV
jgi:hypothetical protein